MRDGSVREGRLREGMARRKGRGEKRGALWIFVRLNLKKGFWAMNNEPGHQGHSQGV